MRKRSIIAAVLACAAALAVPLNAEELDDFRARLREATNGFKDIRATVVVLDSSRRELEKMGKVFAETYQFKKAKVCFKSPDKLKINGELGMMKVEFITAGNTRLMRIPSVRFKRREDITRQQEKRMTPLDVGVVSDAIWGVYKVKLARTEKSDSGSTAYVLRLETDKSQKCQLIWVDGTNFKLLRRDRLLENGSIKVKTVYSNHKQVNGIWVPTRADVYNGNGKWAATTETRDIVTNSGVEDKEFE